MTGLRLGLSLSMTGDGGGLGPELIQNGGFDSDTVWTKGAGWTISGGTGVATTAADVPLSSNALGGISTSKRYRVSFTVSNYSAGLMRVRLGNDTLNNAEIGGINANGDYSYDVQPANVGTDNFTFYATGSPCTLKVDNASVREIL